MYKYRHDMLNRLVKIEGTHLYRETVNGDKDTTVNFYKFGGDRLIGPFSCTNFRTLSGEEYDKIIYLMNHGTDKEIKEFDEGLIELVEKGCQPGEPYIVIDGEGYVLVDNVFDEPEADVKAKGWDDLKDEELQHWCDILDNFEVREGQVDAF